MQDAHKTVLLVDDDREERYLFLEAIKEIEGSIHIMQAVDGVAALETLNTSDPLPDYIFLDLNMPRMDGKKCLTEIRKSPRLKNLRVIICTNSRLQNEMDETRMLGANGFFTKPVNFADFVSVLRFVIGEGHVAPGKYERSMIEVF